MVMPAGEKKRGVSFGIRISDPGSMGKQFPDQEDIRSIGYRLHQYGRSRFVFCRGIGSADKVFAKRPK
jgi:hypothetical protein